MDGSLSMSCNFTSRLDLLPVEQDLNTDLESLIANCSDVCLLVYGSGNPDLAGIGVVISYAFQLGLAILFGPVIFADLFFFSSLRKPRRTSRLVTWLRHNHIVCLSSQLLFATTISLACFIRQTQRSTGIYENSMITELAGLNAMSYVMTLSSFYYAIDRMAIFAAAMLSTYIFSVLAVFILAIHPPQFGRIIRACLNAAKDDELEWTEELVGPYFTEKPLRELIAYTCLIFLLTGLWLVLWIPRGWRAHKNRAKSESKSEDNFEDTKRLFNPGNPQYGCKDLPFPTSRRSLLEWVVGILLMLLSLGLTGVGVLLLNSIFQGREGMILTSNDKYGENLWGIGQIAALFVWAPLLIEMGYTAVNGWKNRSRNGKP